MSVKIRNAKPVDLRKIVDCYGRVGDSPTDPFSNVSRLRNLNRANLLVAEKHGQFAGFLYYFVHRKPWFDPNVDRYASVQELHVVPRFQGIGIGTALMRDALSKIRRRGIKVIYVDTDEDNNVALHLYRKLGFKDFRGTITLRFILNLEQRPSVPRHFSGVPRLGELSKVVGSARNCILSCQCTSGSANTVSVICLSNGRGLGMVSKRGNRS